MDSKKIKVCSVQVKPVLSDKAENLLRAEKFISEAHEQGCNIIVFPETYLTGYADDQFQELAEHIDGESMKHLSGIAKENNIMIIMGFPERIGGNIYNSACVIDTTGEILGAYQKTHLFCEEKSFFKDGDSMKTFDTTLGKIGVIICYDIEFPETARLVALQGANIMFMLGANMFPYEEYHYSFLRTRAMENSVFAISSNFVGNDHNYHFCGRSAIVNPAGEYLSLGSLDKEELLFAELEMKEVYPADDNINYLFHRRPDLYEPLLLNMERK